MAGPFKMKAGKEGPMRKNFPSAFKQDKKKVIENLKNKSTSNSETLMYKRPKNPDGTPYTNEQMNELRKKSFKKDMDKMPSTIPSLADAKKE